MALRSKWARRMGTSVCCSMDKSTTPGTASISLRARLASRRSWYRLSPKIFTATLARVPESMWSMRCEIGWPMMTFMPGISEKSRRNASSNSFLVRFCIFKRHVNLRGLHALGVLVQFRAALAARHAGHFGMREQRALNQDAILVGLFQRRARQRDRARASACLR